MSAPAEKAPQEDGRQTRPQGSIELEAPTLDPDHQTEMEADIQPSEPWAKRFARTRDALEPIAKNVAERTLQFAKNGPLTTGTILWGVEQLATKGTHAAGPYAELALGGIIGTMMQNYINKHPRFKNKVQAMVTVGAEVQAGSMVLSSELISVLQGQQFAPETLYSIGLMFMDEAFSGLMHNRNSLGGRFPLDAQQIARMPIAVGTLIYSLFAADKVAGLGRPEEAWILIGAACLNLGETVITGVDRETVHVQALKRQAHNFAERAIHEHDVALHVYGKAFKSAMTERKGSPFYHKKRKLAHLEMRAMIWSDIAEKVTGFVDSPLEKTREEVEAYIERIFGWWPNPRVNYKDTSFKNTIFNRNQKQETQLVFDFEVIGFPPGQIEQEHYEGVPSHVDTILRKDMKAFLKAARRQANMITPEGWKEEAMNLINFLRYGDAVPSAHTMPDVTPETHIEPVTMVETIPEEVAPLSENEIGWLEFWKSVIDQMDDEYDREAFPQALELNEPDLLRQWLVALEQKYENLIPPEEEVIQ